MGHPNLHQLLGCNRIRSDRGGSWGTKPKSSRIRVEVIVFFSISPRLLETTSSACVHAESAGASVITLFSSAPSAVSMSLETSSSPEKGNHSLLRTQSPQARGHGETKAIDIWCKQISTRV